MGKFKICASEINQNGTMVLGRYKICPHKGCNSTSESDTIFDNVTSSTSKSTKTTASPYITTIYQGTYSTYTANILTVLSTAFGSVTFLTVIWLCMLQPKMISNCKPQCH